MQTQPSEARSTAGGIALTAGMDRELVALKAAMLGAPATEVERLAFDRALNGAKATPGYRAPSDHYALELQNRGVL
ncbi:MULTISPECIES: hypothetical protein [unclassified Variovorax]|uniref:hypothetical protein n=1 Tax=unclassified Variovorax TaxID=663243 RepID=UPI003F450CB4